MREIQDHYFRQAKKENYAARSVYKLKEIQDKKHILNSGQKILELGAYPGSWSQYASKIVGPKGLVLGVDLQNRVEIIADNAPFVHGDVFELELELYHSYAKYFSGIISDMAPNTTGDKSTDHLQSVGLCEKALYLSLDLVKKGGFLLVKIFQGGEFQQFVLLMRKYYGKVDIIKPDSSRKESKEIFILGTNKKEPNLSENTQEEIE